MDHQHVDLSGPLGGYGLGVPPLLAHNGTYGAGCWASTATGTATQTRSIGWHSVVLNDMDIDQCLN
jgi:hypothetical protein